MIFRVSLRLVLVYLQKVACPDPSYWLCQVSQGITVWSPNLDEYGNSVRAVEIAQKLVQNFNFHNYDSLIENMAKNDPRLQKNEDKLKGVMVANFAASQGDLNEIKSLEAKGIT